jgi:hypothetical protein
MKLPGPILLDYDKGMKIPPQATLAWLASRAGVKLTSYVKRRSPSGTGWHLVIWVKPHPKTCMEVVAFQAMFGSDPKRESCNINRARMVDTKQVNPYWRARWNVLYGKD